MAPHACFSVSRNGHEWNTVFMSFPFGGIILGGKLFVCAIEHTCEHTRSHCHGGESLSLIVDATRSERRLWWIFLSAVRNEQVQKTGNGLYLPAPCNALRSSGKIMLMEWT
jgi:hypothetical protein